MTKFIYIFIALVFMSGLTEKSSATSSAFEGRHFFVGYMHNEVKNEIPLYLKVYIATSQTANVSVYLPEMIEQNYVIPANEVFEIDIPRYYQVDTSEISEYKGIEIISDVPISVYAYSTKEMTSDTYSVIPLSYWGDEYVAVSWPNDQYIDANNEFREPVENSEFMIIAAYDNTEIKFQPRSFTKKGKTPFGEYTVTLNKSECYLVKSEDLPIGQGDLSGTIVRGNKPFGFLSGHMRTAIPQFRKQGDDSKDHLCEMLLPTKSWGRFYVSTPFLKTARVDDFVYDPKNDFFKVTCIKENTILTLETSKLRKDYFMSAPGDFVTIPNIGEPAVWTSNKPVQIVQFMAHDTSALTDHVFYDPSMVILPPIDQLVTDINFLTPKGLLYGGDTPQYSSHNIMILAHKNALPTLEYNGISVLDNTEIAQNRILGTDFFWEILWVQEGYHRLNSVDQGFFGILYGWGLRDSYSMVMGASLSNPFKQDTISPEITYTEDCGRIDAKVFELDHVLNSGIDYIHVLEDSTYNYEWQIDKIDFNSMSVDIKAWPKDVFQDGRIMFDYRDRNGNGGIFEFKYKGLNATIPQDLTFSNIKFTDSTCIEFFINNDSDKDLLINSITTSSDPRFKIYYDETLPTNIAPLESMKVTACFDPNGDSTQLNAHIFIGLDCDYTHVININGSVFAAILEVDSLFFGNVLVGETKCLDMTLRNKGNVPIRLDGLKVPLYEDIFVVDTVGIFPHYLLEGEDLKINVCFTPKSRKLYDSYCLVLNHYNLLTVSNFYGRGVAPEIENISVNWVKRRVGTQNDTTLTLTNTGDTTAIITFTDFVVKEFNDRASNALASLNLIIEPNETETFNLFFDPIDTLDYVLIGGYSLNWDLHPPFSIESIGKGTIPTIETFDYEFDTIPILNSIIELPILIRSGGNEALTIDRIYPKSGDISSFNINYNDYDDIVLQPDSSLAVPIEFYPNRSGDFSMIITVISDAMPNFQRVEHDIEIIAHAKAYEADNIELRVYLDEDLFSCDTNILNIEYSNLGELDVSLDSVNISSNVFFYGIDQVLPIILTAGSKHLLSNVFIADKNDIVSFDIRSDFTVLGLENPENFTKFETIDLEQQTESIVFVDPAIPEHTPGETIIVTFAGTLPRKNEEPTGFKIEITYDIFVYDLIDNEVIVKFNNGIQSISKQAQVISNNGILTIEVYISDELMFVQTTDWSFDIEFLTLLHETQNSEIKAKIESEPCFNEINVNIPTILTGICNFNLRPVELITNLTWVNIIPNPVKDELKFIVNIPESDNVDMLISDISGKIIPIKRNFNLKKGIHSIIFEIGQIPNGVYNLVISGKQKATRRFIIYK